MSAHPLSDASGLSPEQKVAFMARYGGRPDFAELNGFSFDRADPIFNGTYVWRDGFYLHGSFVQLALKGNTPRQRRATLKTYDRSMSIDDVCADALATHHRLMILSEGLDMAAALPKLQTSGDPIVIPGSLALNAAGVECVAVLGHDGRRRVLTQRPYRTFNHVRTRYALIEND